MPRRTGRASRSSARAASCSTGCWRRSGSIGRRSGSPTSSSGARRATARRPPAEVAVCQPFLERQIELIRPRHLLFLGGSAAHALLDVTDGVTRLRGRPFLYQPAGSREPIPAAVTFHPAYLLRQPLQKRLVWRDLLNLRQQMEQPPASS